MAFIKTDWAKLDVGQPGFLSQFRYTSEDDLGAVDNTGYFNDVIDELVDGTIITCRLDTASSPVVGQLIVSISGSVVSTTFQSAFSGASVSDTLKGALSIANGIFGGTPPNSVHTFNITGVTISDVVQATIETQTDAVFILKAEALLSQVKITTSAALTAGANFNITVFRG